MKLVLLSFYYPPDLGAGSFRSLSLAKALEKKIGLNDELHVITTMPNRYKTHRVQAKNIEFKGKIKVHRISLPNHKSGMVSQAYAFFMYAIPALNLCRKIRPDFIIGTTSRLMTGVLTYVSAKILKRRYFIDLRDIFSETISDIFSMKSYILSNVLKSIFSFLDKKIFNSASGVNVVSEAFPEYFEKKGIDTSNWSFFPNGIDDEFLDCKSIKLSSPSKVKTILYAGNIGKGQGLELVIPKIAKEVGLDYQFVVIGDGGAISFLRESIKKENITNVELIPPVSRSELIGYYKDADIMFLHLNNIKAFERVLPSKLFEYVALKKPIVAGLSGYSEQFLKKHISHAFLFKPGDYASGALSITQARNELVNEKDIDKFINLFSRAEIMKKMAEHILNISGVNNNV